MAPGLSIMVVDDEPNIRKTLAIALEAEGHCVVAVSNPQDGLAEAARRFFDTLFSAVPHGPLAHP